MESKAEITKAIIKVMQSVAGIEKNMTVGQGYGSYKGVSDKDVKKVIGNAMAANGLAVVPISIEPKLTIERWEENVSGQLKQKQSSFTEVVTKYMLLHESGEYLELVGYGHGTDNQDKGAGKATTYALKYMLLYTFLVPTGDIDDADKTHSNDTETPNKIEGQINQLLIKINSAETVQDLVELKKQNLNLYKDQRVVSAAKNKYDSLSTPNTTPKPIIEPKTVKPTEVVDVTTDPKKKSKAKTQKEVDKEADDFIESLDEEIEFDIPSNKKFNITNFIEPLESKQSKDDVGAYFTSTIQELERLVTEGGLTEADVLKFREACNNKYNSLP